MIVMQDAEVESLEVLVIADDPDLAEMYRLQLELDGYWVRIVGRDTAVAAARARRPDILFLELPPGSTERPMSSRTFARPCVGLSCRRSCWPTPRAATWNARERGCRPSTTW